MNSTLKALSPRDRDFMRECRRVIATSADPHLTVDKVTAEAASRRAPSYYVEYPYAIRKLNAIAARRHKLDGKQCNGRWIEILERAGALMRRHGITRNDAVARVLREGNASSYFLAPASATRLYLRLRHRRPSGEKTIESKP